MTDHQRDNAELIARLGDVLDIIAAAEAHFAQTDEHHVYYSDRHKTVQEAIESLSPQPPAETGDDDAELRIVFDGPPSHESGRFVECETADGRSVNAGQWHERPDGLWELRIASRLSVSTGDNELVAQLRERINLTLSELRDCHFTQRQREAEGAYKHVLEMLEALSRKGRE